MIKHLLPVKLGSVRPLVRYVDEEQAVVDVRVAIQPRLPLPVALPVPDEVDVLVEVRGEDGFTDEQNVRMKLHGHSGLVRYQMVRPQRWWPAGMGEQTLYEMTVVLMLGDAPADKRTVTVGMTSVRPEDPRKLVGSLAKPTNNKAFALLVNGKECEIHSTVLIDQINEQSLLPVAGDSLLIVRDHYGPDVLYEAADRAGLLMIQCVPIHPSAEPEAEMAEQVDRLAPHPSLAGWFVGHLGGLADDLSSLLRKLDPTRAVLRAAS